MKPADFGLLVFICFILGLNLVVSRWVLAETDLPPLAFAAVRFLGVAIVLLPFLKPVPQKLGWVFAIAMGVGAGHFALLFYGLAHAEAGAAGITTQLSSPFAIILSVMFLGEKVGWRRTLGVILSLVGVAMIAIDPEEFSVSFGLVYVACAAMTYAAATILMKKIEVMTVLRMQGWVALFSFAPLIALSATLETGQLQAFSGGGWPLWLAIGFGVFAVSIFAHGSFYRLLQKYDVALVTPMMLLGPIWAVILGVVLLDEKLTMIMVVGGLIALAGMGLIAIRSGITTAPAREPRV